MTQRRRIALLTNPHAGTGRGASISKAAATRFRTLGHDVEVINGADAGEAERRAHAALTRTSERPDCLVVVGGDGSVHLGVNAVAGTGAALGVVPAGTGNDICRAWGVPAEPVAAVDSIDACLGGGTVRDLDVMLAEPLERQAGAAGPRWVAGVIAAGFDAVVNERANGWRWPRGAARYNLAIARELPFFRPVPYRMTLDGEPWITDSLLVAVANTTSYGGGMQIAPDASLVDGLLDVVVVRPVPLLRFIRLFPQVYAGTHVDLDVVEVRRARQVEVHVDDLGRYPREIIAYGDGERLGALPYRFSVTGGAVAVLCAAPT